MIHNYDDFCWRCLTFGQRKPPRPSDARVTGENTGLTTNSASPPPFYRSLSLSTQKAQRKRQTCILPLFNMEEITVEVVSSFTSRRSFDDLGKWSKLVVPSPTSSFFYIFIRSQPNEEKLLPFRPKQWDAKETPSSVPFITWRLVDNKADEVGQMLTVHTRLWLQCHKLLKSMKRTNEESPRTKSKTLISDVKKKFRFLPLS